jgi:phosphoenolpyruvate phosphomutase
MSSTLEKNHIHGEFIGLFKAGKNGIKLIQAALDILSKKENFKRMRMNDLFNEIVKKDAISVRYIKGAWLDINTIVDLQKMEVF